MSSYVGTRVVFATARLFFPVRCVALGVPRFLSGVVCVEQVPARYTVLCVAGSFFFPWVILFFFGQTFLEAVVARVDLRRGFLLLDRPSSRSPCFDFISL